MPKQYRLLILHLFILLLPASNFILILLYGVLRLPVGLVKLGLYWEESLTVLALLGTILATLEQRKWKLPYRFHLALVDLLAICQVVLVLIEAFISWHSYPNLGLIDLMRGLRDQLIYIVAYFIGRHTIPSPQQGWSILRSLVLITILTSVFGLIERFLIPVNFFLWIGTPGFFTNVVGYTFPDASLGLPENFWTSVGGYTVRRATSVYTSSQPFAISYMLLLPPCLWLATQKHFSHQLRFRISGRAMLGWTLVAFGVLILTITRANIVLGLLELGLAALLLRSNIWRINRKLMRIGWLVILAALVVFVVAYRPIIGFIQNTVNLSESSSNLHSQSLAADYQSLQQHPFGLGIATSGITGGRLAERFEDVSASEGQYSKMIRELGIPGIVFYLGMLLGVTRYAYIVFCRNKFARQSITGLGFTVLLAGVAFLFNSITTEWHGALSVSLPFWWLAGTVTTLSFYKLNYAASST